jgi:hypothetical protein
MEAFDLSRQLLTPGRDLHAVTPWCELCYLDAYSVRCKYVNQSGSCILVLTPCRSPSAPT